jgi:methionyl-tRNA synthetase
MPKTSEKGLCYLGWTTPADDAGLAWGGLKEGTTIAKAEALFPRIEEKGE